MAIEEFIAQVDTEFMAAFNSGDAAGCVAHAADDALLVPPGEPSVRGKDVMAAGFKELIDAGWTNLRLSSVETGSGGDLAYHVGKFAYDAPTDDGGTKQETGNYVDIYKRQDGGSWKVHVTIFNSDSAG
jgi:ketosteroid isomerase-like protein